MRYLEKRGRCLAGDSGLRQRREPLLRTAQLEPKWAQVPDEGLTRWSNGLSCACRHELGAALRRAGGSRQERPFKPRNTRNARKQTRNSAVLSAYFEYSAVATQGCFRLNRRQQREQSVGLFARSAPATLAHLLSELSTRHSQRQLSLPPRTLRPPVEPQAPLQSCSGFGSCSGQLK